MINFESKYIHLTNAPIPANIVRLISQIQESKGRQDLFIQQQPDTLNSLLEMARIQSTEASNKIEGIYTSNSRMKEIMEEKTTPKNRDEEEIAGYRDVLDTIHSSYEYIPLSKNVILQLHRDLYKYRIGGNAGKWKQENNIIEEKDAAGNRSVRFIPTPAFEVDESIDNLCQSFNQALNKELNPLIAIFTFILDFLCVHPFSDGNGRMSRLLTLLLLYRSGFIVGKYISLERIIEKNKDTYYSSLKESSKNWHEEQNDIYPFVEYMLGVVLGAYTDFEDRVIATGIKNLSKKEQVRRVFETTLGKITKSQIKTLCPNVSEAMIEKTLKELQNAGYIIRHGAGKGSFYIKVN